MAHFSRAAFPSRSRIASPIPPISGTGQTITDRSRLIQLSQTCKQAPRQTRSITPRAPVVNQRSRRALPSLREHHPYGRILSRDLFNRRNKASLQRKRKLRNQPKSSPWSIVTNPNSRRRQALRCARHSRPADTPSPSPLPAPVPAPPWRLRRADTSSNPHHPRQDQSPSTRRPTSVDSPSSTASIRPSRSAST